MKLVIENSNSSDIVYNLKANEEVTYIALKDVNNRIFNLKENTKLNYLNLNFNSKYDNLVVNLRGYNANFTGKTLTIGTSGAYTFNQVVNHHAKSTNSNITNLCLSLGNAKIAYTTIGHIFNGNTKSKCQQLAKGIIISDKSEIKAEPILLIDENDVFAYHGAAIGKMSDDELFYLMSRGLSKDDALKLMVQAIINPFVEELPEELKKETNKKIEKRIKL